MRLKSLMLLMVGAFVFSVFSTSVFAAGTVKIAYIDPLSGGFGDVGDAGHKHFKFMADKIKAEGGFLGGMNFEIVPFDKICP